MQPWRIYAIAGKRVEELKALLAPRMATELPKGEGTDYTIYPEPLTDPYRVRRFAVGELLYRSINVPRDDKPARYRQYSRNYEFFGAPVALFFAREKVHDADALAGEVSEAMISGDQVKTERLARMPWLAGTALLHSAVVMEKRNALKIWTILLAILAFSLSLVGTFLVRSGVLTSVHTFASDPARGVFILAILVIFIGGGLSLFAWRAPLLKQGGLFAPISREGALVLNNLFLTTACLTVFVGTLYPLALEAIAGTKISVGPPFFNLTFGPLFVPLLFAMIRDGAR